VAERRVSGVEIAGQGGAEHAIERVPTGVAAFVGRCLKGPVNRPLSVTSFSEFSQIFGGLWQPSTLSYAVEQFFENGGREAFIVRVTNGARPPSLTLPAGQEQLKLIALHPGSREFCVLRWTTTAFPIASRIASISSCSGYARRARS
jgi:hypothetical protein